MYSVEAFLTALTNAASDGRIIVHTEVAGTSLARGPGA